MGKQTAPANEANTSTTDYTYVYAETASEAGYITKIEIYAIGASTGFEFAVFSRSGDNFTDVASITLTLAAGLNTF